MPDPTAFHLFLSIFIIASIVGRKRINKEFKQPVVFWFFFFIALAWNVGYYASEIDRVGLF